MTRGRNLVPVRTTNPRCRSGIIRLNPWGHALAAARICCSSVERSCLLTVRSADAHGWRWMTLCISASDRDRDTLQLLQVASIYLRHRSPPDHVEVSRRELLMSLQDAFCRFSLAHPNLSLFAFSCSGRPAFLTHARWK